MSVELLSMDVYLAQSLQLATPVDAAGGVSEASDWTVLAALEELREEGEPDLIVELIDLYLTDAPQWVEAMRTAAAETDAAQLKRAAHTLKGSSGSVGIRQVAEACALLEQVDLTDAGARAERLLQQLDREFAAAREALAVERARRIA